IYSGALLSHLGGGYACPGWPFCLAEGTRLDLVQINLLHRGMVGLALLLALGLIPFLHWQARSRSDLQMGAWALLAALGAQALAGGFLVLSHWSLNGRLLHAGITAVVFAALAYLCLRSTLRSAQPG
ncbi:MAG: hypothetical protein ACREN8_08175, partial [Candidatus Dormibacteraceae bacterium]